MFYTISFIDHVLKEIFTVIEFKAQQAEMNATIDIYDNLSSVKFDFLKMIFTGGKNWWKKHLFYTAYNMIEKLNINLFVLLPLELLKSAADG